MSMKELAQHSPQLDIRASAECRCQSWSDINPRSIFGTCAECRCQSWFDIRPSSIFGTRTECRCQRWLDIRPCSIFELVPNVDDRAGSLFAQLDNRE
ncbi:hypothetical protein DPMN_125781 [Dreissena polymorpha]|uniref:Uncharacterized protein n=1 Tax=Dreissena polymorpha TaxID=45954 RepID=A0A9D4JTV5_DREPO|nr:hypothetical protein DPMN_125781 [Dreissena polymorpha]